jgi:hypothetical protein
MHFLATAAIWVSTCSFVATAHPALRREDSLNWSTCDYDFNSKAPLQCATLRVPLDWTNETSESLHLQLLRVKATSEPFMGSILFNPGGPGGLGTQHVATQEANINRYESRMKSEFTQNLH